MNGSTQTADSVVPPVMDDDAWEILVSQIQKKEVVPVVGSDLITVSFEGQSLPYERFVAQRLAQKPEYAITDEDLKPLGVTLEQASLNDVMSVCVKKRPSKWPVELHQQVWRIVSEAQCPVPPALAKLAQITDFDLFVTSTFDPLLESALSDFEKASNGPMVELRSYQGLRENDIEDLQNARDEHRRFLYYLFGKATRGDTDFAICDVQILRFLIKLHDADYRPKLLFDALREKHLLLLGINFSDWLARFFLWLAKARENEPNRKLREYLADQKVGQDRQLVLFLEHFSDTTRVVGVNPEMFVNELYTRWSTGPALAPKAAPLQPAPDMPKDAVFISYSRSDRTAAQNLFAQLAGAGIPAWYDAGLVAGNEWRETVHDNIEKCSVFVPLISSVALLRGKAEFRAEWDQAVTLDKKWFGLNRTGIVPIIVDEDDDILSAPKPVAGLPDAFVRAQMYHCPRGIASQGLLDRLRVLQRKADGQGSGN